MGVSTCLRFLCSGTPSVSQTLTIVNTSPMQYKSSSLSLLYFTLCLLFSCCIAIVCACMLFYVYALMCFSACLYVCVLLCIHVCVCVCVQAIISLVGVIIFGQQFYGDVNVSPFGWSFALTIIGTLIFLINGVLLILHTINIHRHLLSKTRHSRAQSSGFMGFIRDCFQA